VPLTLAQKGCNSPYMTIRGVTFPSSYSAGGLALSAADLGWNNVSCVWAQSKGGLDFEYDHLNAKLKAYLGSTDTSGVFAYSPGGGDVKGATAITGAMGTADQAADIVNAATWVAYQSFTTINGAAGSFGSITAQPPLPRNAVVSVKNASGGALNLFAGTMTITVTGTFRGAAQVEAIACTLTGGQKAVANTKFRAFAGAKPFDSITSVTIDATSLASIVAADGALQIGIGPGVLFGFPVAPDTGTNGDITSFSVNAAARAVAGNTDFANQTLNVGTIADGDDIAVIYKIDVEAVSGTAYGTSFALPEVPASTDLSGLGEVLVFAVGHNKT